MGCRRATGGPAQPIGTEERQVVGVPPEPRSALRSRGVPVRGRNRVVRSRTAIPRPPMRPPPCRSASPPPLRSRRAGTSEPAIRPSPGRTISGFGLMSSGAAPRSRPATMSKYPRLATGRRRLEPDQRAGRGGSRIVRQRGSRRRRGPVAAGASGHRDPGLGHSALGRASPPGGTQVHHSRPTRRRARGRVRHVRRCTTGCRAVRSPHTSRGRTRPRRPPRAGTGPP